MTTPVRFQFDFHGSVSLSVEEIWPDGDAPENPTVQDVIAWVRDCIGGNSRVRMLDEWDLAPHVGVLITGPGGSEEVP